MARSPLRQLRSEATALKQLLSELPEDRFIERMGLESRLADVEEEVARLSMEPQPKPFPITFRGAPVHGSHAIDANFASLALKGLIDAIDTVAASLTAPELKATGPVPGVGARSLQIVDTAVGSFGFELELPPALAAEAPQAMLPLGPPPVDTYAQAISTTLSLIQGAAIADEDAMSDLIAEVHPRAASKVRAFAKVLADNDAVFAAEFENRQVRLSSSSDVKRVIDALRDEDIGERTEALEGRLLGILPESRVFECRLPDGRIVRGKVDRAVEDIARFKSRWESVDAKLTFRVISVRAKERHVLVGAAAL